MAHDEFPPLTRDTKAVFDAGMLDLDTFAPWWTRRFASAVIREAMKQASSDRPDSCKWNALGAIADNLHALPPPPPTREELDQALLELEAWERFSEIRTTEWFKERFAVLRRGIAHHCKVQP